MSGIEIERKFLVKKGADYKRQAHKRYEIKQGYIPAKNATVRIRLRNDKGFLTIKSRKTGAFSRYEFEKEINLEEAVSLLRLCDERQIEKTRYLVDIDNHTFEIDEFHGLNEGLVIAEIELKSEDETFPHPDFLDKEVTTDTRYFNSALTQSPYSLWKQQTD